MADEEYPSGLIAAVGLRLLATRFALGRVEGVLYSQEMLAHAIGVSRAALANWEQMKRLPSVPAMIRLTQRFPITLDWLYHGKLFGMPFEMQQALEASAAEVGAPTASSFIGLPIAREQDGLAARGRTGGLARRRAKG